MLPDSENLAEQDYGTPLHQTTNYSKHCMKLPVNLRREKLALQYITKLKSNLENPTYKCVFEPSFAFLFEARPSVIPTIGI
jgi:hypothetical protein